MMKNKVRLNERDRQFEMTEDGKTAFVKYECFSGGMDFISTFVPEEWRGQGIGTFLVSYALAYAKERHLKIGATCPFVRAYIYKHKEFAEE